MKVTFIQTGGTIDKDYPQKTKGWAFEFGEPATKRLLERLNPSFEYEIITAFQKDSLEIIEEDRKHLSDIIKKLSTFRIIVTHGTDTLIETALYLNEHLTKKVVILTGAMRPERFSNSDAPINIGAAIAAVQLHDHGVYICMNGIVKHCEDISRNTVSGKFL